MKYIWENLFAARPLQRGMCLLIAAFLCACGAGDGNPTVTAAAVTRIDAAGAPRNSDAQQLKAGNYMEEEFHVQGNANRYRIRDLTANAQMIDSGHPYLTRALVRRPADPARFNGTVVVEWLNVSLGQDVDFIYGSLRELLIRDGYAWVGVSAQRVGVDALVQWDTARYGKLTVKAPNTDPLDGKDIDPPVPLTASAGGDVLAWDVFSQIAAAVVDRSSPIMGGLKVNHVIAAGESQSAFRLSRYFNSIHPLHRVYNGFLFYDRGPEFTLRTDIGTKLMSVGTEFMNFYLGGSPQPDTSDQRWWEVAGASHVSLDEMTSYIDPQVVRDRLFKAPDGTALGVTDLLTAGCAITPVWSRVPNGDVMKAALKALNTWLVSGVAPATVTRFALDSQKQMVRDAQGRVSGGIRTAAYDAPRSTNVGVNSGGCTLAGYHIDFTPQQMCQRYGSHAAYVTQVQAIANSNVSAGVLLPEEAARTVNDAQQLTFDCSGS